MARILVVDDDEMNRNVLEGMLTAVGHEVLLASDGEEGVQMFRKEQVHLVATDIMMPGKTGIELILELKGKNPGVRILALAAGGDEVLQHAQEAGADAILGKPFRMEDLLQIVDGLLSPEA